LKPTQKKRLLEPVILTNTLESGKLMENELRAPVLIINKFSEVADISKRLNDKNVRNIYYFSNTLKNKVDFVDKYKNANIVINNADLQHLDPYYPYGSNGIFAASNIGGKYGFKTFSINRTITDKGMLPYFKTILPPFNAEKYSSLKKYKTLSRLTNRKVKKIGLGIGLIAAYFYFK